MEVHFIYFVAMIGIDWLRYIMKCDTLDIHRREIYTMQEKFDIIKQKRTVIYSPTITGFQCRTCYRCIELMYLENDHWAYYRATKVAVTMYLQSFSTLTHFDSCLIVSLLSFMHSFHILLYEIEVTWYYGLGWFSK